MGHLSLLERAAADPSGERSHSPAVAPESPERDPIPAALAAAFHALHPAALRLRGRPRELGELEISPTRRCRADSPGRVLSLRPPGPLQIQVPRFLISEGGEETERLAEGFPTAAVLPAPGIFGCAWGSWGAPNQEPIGGLLEGSTSCLSFLLTRRFAPKGLKQVLSDPGESLADLPDFYPGYFILFSQLGPLLQRGVDCLEDRAVFLPT